MSTAHRGAGFFYPLFQLIILSCLLGANPELAQSRDFFESWESSPLGVIHYDDPTIFEADMGIWYMGNTVSNFPECGPTPHAAEIVVNNGEKALRLTSNDSNSSCADNLWVEIREIPPANINPGFSIPLDANSVLSFREHGSLVDPGPIGSATCVARPCGDNISLVLQDPRGFELVYVLQRAPGQVPDRVPSRLAGIYKEIFLDPDAGSYSRNLLNDFGTIRGYNPNGASIGSISFQVDEHGTGTIDDIVISSSVVAPPVPSPALLSAVLPASRSVQVGHVATAFGTAINASSDAGTNCGIGLGSNVAVDFHFQTTDPATNEVIGSPDATVDIPAGQAQSFVVALTPTAPVASTQVQLVFDCANSDPSPAVVGLNTLLLSASADPVPDIVALAATLSGDGIVNVPGTSRTGVFAVAVVNVGSSGMITATADTGGVALPVDITLCETDPVVGDCRSPPVNADAGVMTQIDARQTPTFGIFVTGEADVAFDPANNRIFVRFADASGVVRGATSVAVRTATP